MLSFFFKSPVRGICRNGIFLFGGRGGGGGLEAAVAIKVNTRDRIYNVMHERGVKT